MKKILASLVILSCILLTSSFVIANSTKEQGISAKIAETINLIITPDSLGFGDIIQGSENNTPTNGPIKFNAGTGSNTNINIEFTSVTANGLFELMELETTSATWVKITNKPFVEMPCTVVNNTCNYTEKLINAKLKVPAGYPAGDKTGIITYTLTGPAPVCTPNCTGKTCGDDGCSGSCGTCSVNETCSAGICIS